jgi:GntR family transcriptional regulator
VTNVPRYRAVYDVLRYEIMSEILPIGRKLPTEDELTKRFGVSRHTIRVALRELKEEGLIRSQQGAGSTVLHRSQPVRYTSSISSLEELLQYATEIRYEVAKSGMIVADRRLSARIGCAVGQRWLRLQGIRTSKDEAVCWTEVFVHAQYAGVGLMIGHRSGSIFSFIEEMYAVRVGEVDQVLRVVPMPNEVCSDLGCEAGSMAVEIRRSYKLESGELVEIAFTLHPADRFKYQLVLRRRG